MIPKLTRKQLALIQTELIYSKRNWRDKIPHALKILRNFYRDIDISNIEWYLEVYVPSEDKRIKKEFMQKSSIGELHNKYTPTDVSNTLGRNFTPVISPIVGEKYHVSWAFKGAVFTLKRIEGEYAYLDNPKHKRKVLLKVLIQDLRNLK